MFWRKKKTTADPAANAVARLRAIDEINRQAEWQRGTDSYIGWLELVATKADLPEDLQVKTKISPVGELTSGERAQIVAFGEGGDMAIFEVIIDEQGGAVKARTLALLSPETGGKLVEYSWSELQEPMREAAE